MALTEGTWMPVATILGFTPMGTLPQLVLLRTDSKTHSCTSASHKIKNGSLVPIHNFQHKIRFYLPHVFPLTAIILGRFSTHRIFYPNPCCPNKSIPIIFYNVSIEITLKVSQHYYAIRNLIISIIKSKILI